MKHIGTEKLQLGQTGWILGDLPNLLAGAMEVDIFSCPNCRKLEFFVAGGEEEDALPQKNVPAAEKCTILIIPNAPSANTITTNKTV